MRFPLACSPVLLLLLQVLPAGCRSDDATPAGAPPLPCLGGEAGAGWCWVRGLPLSVDGDRELGTAFAIGAAGTFLRLEGETWVPTPVPTPRTLTSGWAGSLTNAWVIDDAGSSWRFDGAAWTEVVPPSPLLRLLGTPSGALWAMTQGAAAPHGGASRAELLRQEGGRWVRAMEPFDYCMGGDYVIAADGSPWSAGLMCDAGGIVTSVEVRRWDGAAWQLVGAPIDGQGWYPTLVRQGDAVHVNASGSFRWTGTAWEAFTPPERNYPQGLPFDVTAFWDGVGFLLAPRSLGCEGAFRLDEARAFCFGSGRIYQNRGQARGQAGGGWWSPSTSDPFAQTQGAARWGTLPPVLWSGGDTLRAWGSGPDHVFRVRADPASPVELYDGASWRTALDRHATDIHGAGPGDVWFSTAQGPVHFDGGAFVELPIPPALTSDEVTGVLALGTGVGLAFTDDAVLLHDGSWRSLYTPPVNWRVVQVAGSGPRDLWAIQARAGRSDEAALLHFDGDRWSQAVPGMLSAWGGPRLFTRGTDTWLADQATVIQLGSAAPPVAVDRLSIGADLWIGPDAIWLTTDKVARRHAHPLAP